MNAVLLPMVGRLRLMTDIGDFSMRRWTTVALRAGKPLQEA
jgi:hypothetical protein